MAIEKILVVDDEPFIAKSISEALRSKRYSVSTADSLAKAERLLRRDVFDIMLLDVNLPDGKGPARGSASSWAFQAFTSFSTRILCPTPRRHTRELRPTL